eukprot:TRINITY_DN1973_c0_g1_i1.p1 TRINITY_DN1973_c0_g1~~TRINITY_DN1973_c0_g1_i1.p1  ORF type:complete len:620 (+),score=154.28 TRINITY_DN1973_c0_g1_i1:310-2169(+)
MSLNADLMLMEDDTNSPEEFPEFDALPRYNHNQLADLLDVNPLGNSQDFMTYYPPTSEVLSIETPTIAPQTPFTSVTTMPSDFAFRGNNGSDDLPGPRGNKRAKPWTNQELYYTPQARENFAAPASIETRQLVITEFKREPIQKEYLEEAGQINAQLKQLQLNEKTSKDFISKIGKEIKNLSLPVSPDDASRIEKSLQDLLLQVENDSSANQRLFSNHVIEPKGLFQIVELEHLLYIHTQQLKLYHHELQYLKQSTPNSPARGFACLVVAKQPFPKTIKQLTKCSSPGEDPITVLFMKGGKTEVMPNGKVKATLIFDDYQGKKQTLEVQQDTQELDNSNQAVFSNLRFPSGTRMKTARLQFTLDVKYSDRTGSVTTGMIESDTTAPFIVVTNESQWDLAAGALLKKEAFEQGRELQWAHFANILQFHYLRATRQSISQPQRPLSREELDYFQREKFSRKQIITQKDFDKFWEWFGKVLYKIRHQKHFCPMWVQGFVYGFLTKAEAEELLRNEPPGTFVLRFSERAAGKVAVAYVKRGEPGKPNEIKHYLIDPHSENKDSVTLPEFLTPHGHFLYFLQLDTNFFSAKMSWKRSVSKSEVLKTFFMSKDDNGLAGYESELS